MAGNDAEEHHMHTYIGKRKDEKKNCFPSEAMKICEFAKIISYSTQRTWTIFFLIHKHFSKASNTCYFCVHPHIQSTYMADVVAMPQTFDICFLYVSVLIYSVYVLQCIWSFIAIHFFSIFFFLVKMHSKAHAVRSMLIKFNNILIANYSHFCSRADDHFLRCDCKTTMHAYAYTER